MLPARRACSGAIAVLVLLAGVLAPTSSAARPGAAAEDVPVWRITEVAVPTSAPAGAVKWATAACPSGQSIIGGDIRDISDVQTVVPQAAVPFVNTESFFAAVGVGGTTTQTFTVVAYCVPTALLAGRTVVERVYSLPAGVTDTGGGATCAAGSRAIGGGAWLADPSANENGYLRSNGPHPLGRGWYATARLQGTSLRVSVVCMPDGSVPPVSIATRTAEAGNDVFSYYFGQGSASCPNGTRVLAGGAYIARPDQFPDPEDPSQGRVAQSVSRNGYWHTVIGMNPGYWSTTVVLCVPDADPPTVTMTKPVASPFAARVALDPGIDVAWTGSDGAGQVVGYQTRVRRASATAAFGAWQYPDAWSDLAAVGLVHNGTELGSTYCYSARGRDDAGNWSAWAVQRCAVRPLDDRSLIISDGWTRGALADYWNGTATRTAQQGAVLSRPGARFNQLALIATKCPTCGRVAVAVDGVLIGTVNLANATTVHQRVISLPRTPGREGTVTIEVLSTGKPVIIDGLAVSAS
ncbi:hypothetical protein [Nocardioides antri]|uniref:Fibronectin type-III domain-containing protein n=1 Tax=Nocardioides antri TaxID=2607659 RepID=A0A5B1LXF1_9ACTN|nr:hypothetical protein [Nocardioides antri]KAA1425655.1 hypothetical protein F0U47_17880 [Nocardioides antri]